MTETTTAPEVRVERTFDAPREAVFDAWTTPEVLRRWWVAMPGGTCTLAEVDLRVGGGYRLSMAEPSGGVHTVAGEYVEISRPDLIAYTWAWEGNEEGVSLVTVEFLDANGRTRVVITHGGIDDGESRGRHEHGWHGVLSTLAEQVFPDARAGG